MTQHSHNPPSPCLAFAAVARPKRSPVGCHRCARQGHACIRRGSAALRVLAAVMVGTLAAAALAEPEVIGPVSPELLMEPRAADPGVGDLDPLARSLRRLEPGNALHSSRVRTVPMPGAHHFTGQPHLDPATGLPLPTGYRYSAPGVQAMFDRPDYLVRTGPGRHDLGRNVAAQPDGAIQERVPAGTVYDLRPEAAWQHLTHANEADAAAHWQDTRIDHRYRIDGRVGSRSQDQSFDRSRYPHIPADTLVPSRLPRRFDADTPEAPLAPESPDPTPDP